MTATDSTLIRSRFPEPQVRWRSRGSGTMTVVLINGFGASSIGWPREWVRTLADDARVIMPDNRGSGWSQAVEAPFTVRDMADDVIDVLDDAEVERAVLMGLSMGGMIAQEVALAAPERVAALCLVGTRPPAPKFTPPSASAAFALMRPLLPWDSLSNFYRRLWTAAAAPGFAERHPDRIEELVSQCIERPTPRAMLTNQMRALVAWGHAERLTRIAAPTVVVHGERDLFAPSANAAALAELIPGARLTLLADVGHLVPLEAPDRLGELLLDLAAGARPAARKRRAKPRG